MRRQDKLLLYCIRYRQNERPDKRMQELAGDKPDWGGVIHSASSHAVLPLLYQCLRQWSSGEVPEDALQQLKEYSFSNGARNLYLADVLLKIIDLFKENGISAIPFKGPLLAETVYKDLSLRCIYDLDILIPGSDLLLAYNLLLTSGYEPEIRLSPDRLVWYCRHEDNLTFSNKEKGVVVELHWELSGLYLHHSLTYGEIEPRLESAELLGRDVVNLQPDILLLYLCVHGAKHMWERLEWVCGVSELVQMHPEFVWEELFEFVDALQCKRMLLLGLYLARDFFWG